LLCLGAVGVAWKELTDLPPRPDLSSGRREMIKEADFTCSQAQGGPPKAGLPVNGVWQGGDEASAVVRIEAILEMAEKEGAEQNPLVATIQEYALRVPKRVRATIWDLSSEAGKAELKKRGLSGPAVFINGRHEFHVRWRARDMDVDLTKLVEQPVDPHLLRICISDEYISKFHFGGKPVPHAQLKELEKAREKAKD